MQLANQTDDPFLALMDEAREDVTNCAHEWRSLLSWGRFLCHAARSQKACDGAIDRLKALVSDMHRSSTSCGKRRAFQPVGSVCIKRRRSGMAKLIKYPCLADGVLPHTPIQHVEFMLDFLRRCSAK